MHICEHPSGTSLYIFQIYSSVLLAILMGLFAMGTRRPHRKSRHGCLNCKRRKIKVNNTHSPYLYTYYTSIQLCGETYGHTYLSSAAKRNPNVQNASSSACSAASPPVFPSGVNRRLPPPFGLGNVHRECVPVDGHATTGWLRSSETRFLNRRGVR